MIQQPHDKFAKEFLEELLAPLGEVKINKEVTDAARFVDVLFSAAPQAQAPNLGLLGRIALLNTALLEPFRNQPSRTEVRNCFLKLFTVIADSQRKAKREETTIAEDSLARLWIIAPSTSETLLADLDVKLDLENWPTGVYFFQKCFRAAIVAVNKLPVTSETLDPSENSQANIYKALRPVLADSVSTKKSVFDIVTDSLEQKNT